MTSTLEQVLLASSAEVRAFAAFFRDQASAGKLHFVYSFPAETSDPYDYFDQLPAPVKSIARWFSAVTHQTEFRVLPASTFTAEELEEMVQEPEFAFYEIFRRDRPCMIFSLFPDMILDKTD
jgi:hypothetical protein